MSEIEAGHRAILEAFIDHQVKFVLVGGVGLQARGFSQATKDVDVTVAIDEQNVARVNRALEALRANRIDPAGAVASLDDVRDEEVAEVAASFTGPPSVACVGPHAEDEFDG